MTKRIVFIILMSAVMLESSFSQTTADQLDRSKEPVPGLPPSLTLPTIERGSLTNGLQIMVVKHSELPVVQMQLVVRSGSDADPIGKAGLAQLTANMLDEGTATRTALDIADEIDFIGAQLSSSSSFDGSFVNLMTLKEHLGKAMEVFADVIVRPSFPQSDFDRLKKDMLTGLIQQKDRVEVIAGNVFYRRLFGQQHPYGYQTTGTDSTVQTLELDDLKKFYQTYYAPNNATLIIVGDIVKDEAIQLAEEYLGNWKSAEVPEKKLGANIAEGKTTFYVVHKSPAPQSQLRLGNIALERNSEDYYAASLLNQIIGASNGRLFLNLREAKGYTYGAYAQFVMRKAAGPFLAYAGVKTNVTDSSLIEFMKEINRVRDEPIPESEFNMYKRSVIQRIPRLFETPSQISSQVASLVLYGLPDNYYDSLVERYQALTAEDIQRVARKYLRPDALTIVVVGDKNLIMEGIQKLGFGKIVECDFLGNVITN